MSNEIFVAFATQKGGIGKSTVPALAASYLHNVQGHNVAVIDCDAPQHSIHGLRERETKLIDESLYFKALACDHLRNIKERAYADIASDAHNALDDPEGTLAEECATPHIVFSVSLIHLSEPTRPLSLSYAVFCLKKKKKKKILPPLIL